MFFCSLLTLWKFFLSAFMSPGSAVPPWLLHLPPFFLSSYHHWRSSRCVSLWLFTSTPAVFMCTEATHPRPQVPSSQPSSPAVSCSSLPCQLSTSMVVSCTMSPVPSLRPQNITPEPHSHTTLQLSFITYSSVPHHKILQYNVFLWCFHAQVSSLSHSPLTFFLSLLDSLLEIFLTFHPLNILPVWLHMNLILPNYLSCTWIHEVNMLEQIS